MSNEIRKMVADGICTLPTSINKTTLFGVQQINDGKFVTKTIKPEELSEAGVKTAIEIMPKFEYYYYKSIEIEQNKFTDPIDDFFSSVGDCNIHFIAIGTLEYKDASNIEVHVTEIGAYIKDGFDFTDGNAETPNTLSQLLGFWSFEKNDVSRISISPDYRLLDNRDYRNYRLSSGKGRDFYRYSNMFIYQPNFRFILK